MNLTVALTGASGAVLCQELLLALEADERVARVHFVASENSLRVLAEELGLSGRTDLLEKLLDGEPSKTVQHVNTDIGAAIASGSYPSNGMIVLPCSMGTLATVANGVSVSAPELSAGSATTGLTLLLGGLAVLAGRRRSIARGLTA